MAQARTTIDHETIRKWVESRGGHPAHVKATGSDDDPGVLRIDFPGYSGEDTLAPITWDDFFEKFEANDLAFLYQDEDDSRFSKLVSRGSADLDEDDDDEGDDDEGDDDEDDDEEDEEDDDDDDEDDDDEEEAP